MTLRVYLHDRLCGHLSTTDNRGVVFCYDENYLCSSNAQALSISLPLGEDEFQQKECLPYFSGLLPEGKIKRKISSYLHVSESSTVRLLEVLGGECAGTVVFNSEDEPPLQLKTEYELREENYTLITDKEISELIDKMEASPPWSFQEKISGCLLPVSSRKLRLPTLMTNGSFRKVARHQPTS